MRRVFTAMAVVCLCSAQLGPTAAQDTTADTAWNQMLQEIGAFSERIWTGPGLQVSQTAQKPREIVLNFNSGYRKTGRWVVDWRDQAYRPSGSNDRQALRLMQAEDAEWIRDLNFGPVEAPVPSLALTTDFDPSRPSMVTRQESADAVSYEIPDLETTLRIGPDWMTRSDGEGTTTWRIASSAVAAPSAVVVDSRDIDSARSSVSALKRARSTIQSGRDSRSVKQLRRTAKNQASTFQVRNIVGGFALIAHDRYLNRVWRLRWDNRLGKVRVRTVDRHPPGWVPPRRTVTIEPAQAARSIGRDAAVLLDRAAIWTQQQPGVLIAANQSMVGADGPRILSLDYTRGLTGFIDDDGAAVNLRNPSAFRECYLMSRVTPRLRKALQLAGRPYATWECSGEGDTDLAWVPGLGPVGIAAGRLTFRILFDSSLTLTHDGDDTVLSMGDASDVLVTLRFSGASMLGIRLSEPEVPDLVFGYTYGPQNLRMPPLALRIKEQRLRQAEDSLAAQRSVRLTSTAVKTCASKHINRAVAPVVAIRDCALRIGSKGDAVVTSTHVPGGVRLYVRNQFGVDSRDVVVSTDGTRAVVTRIIHRR
jgi:hypothetical protein